MTLARPPVDEREHIRVLTRTFLVRFFESEVASGGTDVRQSTYWVAALLATPGMILPILFCWGWAFLARIRGLDVSTGLILRSVVQALADDGRMVFYSSHELETVEKISTRVIILRSGSVVADDSAAHLRELMRAPSLEDVFAQLAVRENVEGIAQDIVETVRL